MCGQESCEALLSQYSDHVIGCNVQLGIENVKLLYILVHLTHTKYSVHVCVRACVCACVCVCFVCMREGRSACMHMYTNSTMEVYRLTLLHIHTHAHTPSALPWDRDTSGSHQQWSKEKDEMVVASPAL